MDELVGVKEKNTAHEVKNCRSKDQKERMCHNLCDWIRSLSLPCVIQFHQAGVCCQGGDTDVYQSQDEPGDNFSQFLPLSGRVEGPYWHHHKAISDDMEQLIFEGELTE